jgi:hypothetical protein
MGHLSLNGRGHSSPLYKCPVGAALWRIVGPSIADEANVGYEISVQTKYSNLGKEDHQSSSSIPAQNNAFCK